MKCVVGIVVQVGLLAGGRRVARGWRAGSRQAGSLRQAGGLQAASRHSAGRPKEGSRHHVAGSYQAVSRVKQACGREPVCRRQAGRWETAGSQA